MEKIRAEKKAKDEANFKAFDELVKSAKAKVERKKIEARQAEQGALYCREKEAIEDGETIETSAEASARVYKKAMSFVTDGDEVLAGGEETKSGGKKAGQEVTGADSNAEKRKKRIPCGIDPLTGDTLYKEIEDVRGNNSAQGGSGTKFMSLLSGAMAEKAEEEAALVAKSTQREDKGQEADIFADEAAELEDAKNQDAVLKDENGGASFLAAAAGVDMAALD